MSAWFPSEAKREMPRPTSDASSESSIARFPLCEITTDRPGDEVAGREVELGAGVVDA
jgi:hypothetical protein